MKPFLLLRTYSGLDPLAWKPSGTPAIWNLVERLKDRNIPAVVVFSEKETNGRSAGLEKVEDPFFAPLTVYRVGYAFGNLPSAVAVPFNRVRMLAITLRLLRRHGCRLVFADRVHLIDAALLSLIGIPVIWRCLGAAPFVINQLQRGFSARILAHLDKLAVRAPIRAVICSRDGAAWWRFLPSDRLGKSLFVPLNGVSRHGIDAKSDLSVAVVPRILFVNRMIGNKHPLVVVEALSKLKRAGHRFEATLAGYGPELERVREAVERNGLSDCVTITGRVPSRDLPELLSRSDIAININRGGQLSNTVLEALTFGLCPVVFGADTETETDVDTVSLLPEDMACFIDRDNPVDSLMEALADLLRNPEEIVVRKRKARDFAESHIEDWALRIDREIALMSQVEAGNRSFNAFTSPDKIDVHEEAEPTQVS